MREDNAAARAESGSAGEATGRTAAAGIFLRPSTTIVVDPSHYICSVPFPMNPPNISDAEWTVMETLWDRSPQTASEVARSLQSSTGWAVNTVRTMLARLTEKGAVVAAENSEGVRAFSPAVPREVVVRRESESFLNRVFRGAAQPLLLHFASRSDLTPEEVRQLKALLDESIQKNS
jgi:BlaI family penicillinase repressor